MNKSKTLYGHIAVFFTIFIWGTTFISTKILLKSFSPIEILFIRFLVGYLCLWVLRPHLLVLNNKKQELYILLAGFCGVTLYFLLENISLTYTLASNVGVIISIAPFFTSIFSYLFLHTKRPDFHFLLGFIISLIGVCLISFTTSIHINPVGDLLAVLAAIVWAAYSILVKKISTFGYNTILTTRRTFFFGLLFMIPTLFIMNFSIGVHELTNLKNIFNLLFLGLGASALCFVAWNFAVKILGSVKTSVYIYLVPIITAITSTIILHEQITFLSCFGIILTIFGLILSQFKFF